MPIKLKQLTQSEWITPDVTLYTKTGDFSQLTNLTPSADRRQLRRLPAWSAQVRTDTNGLVSVEAIFYDAANSRTVIIGGDGGSNLLSAYLDSTWTLSNNTTLHATPTGLGGLSCRNLVYWGGYLYLIGSDQKVYRGTTYAAALAEYDASTNHRILIAVDEDVYVVKDNGTIEKTNSDATAFNTYVDAKHDYNIRALIPFRSYALVIARHPTGSLDFYRLELGVSTRYFNQITSLHVGGTEPSYGSLYTIHDDHVYFSPGYLNATGSQIMLPIYQFNGSWIEHVTNIQHDPNTGGSGFPTGAGLLSWRGKLIYYALEGTSQIFKALHGDKFIDYPALTATATSTPIAANAGGTLVTVADDTNEGVHYLQDSTMADADLITSWYDMDSPGKEKRLEAFTVVLSDKATSFTIRPYYRLNPGDSWTALTTATNDHLATDTDLGISFYTIQFKVTLDDDTGNNEDIRIESISAIYAMGDL